MERWISHENRRGENQKIDAFLTALLRVCEEHGMTLSHEDGHGAFEVYDGAPDAAAAAWIMSAHDETGEP